MRPGRKAGPCGPKLFMANAGFERDVLRIQPSDLKPPFAEHNLGVGATFYIGGVSVIIMGAAPSWRVGVVGS